MYGLTLSLILYVVLYRQLASLTKKSDERLTLYLHDFKQMCWRVLKRKKIKKGKRQKLYLNCTVRQFPHFPPYYSPPPLPPYNNIPPLPLLNYFL